MKKTSLYIDPEVDRALTRRAAAEGVSKAELVRGVFEGARDLGAEVDRHLVESGFGE
jgi:hypothetical protein